MKKLFALMIVLAILFAGCSAQTGGTEDTTPASDNTVEQSKTDTEKEMTEAEEVNLKLFISQPRFREIYEGYIDQFVDEYEAEKNIKLTYDLEMPSADNSSEILKTRFELI